MIETNYCYVYVTRNKSGVMKLWGEKPKKDNYGGWVNHRGNKPLTGETLELVNAQVYGESVVVNVGDDEATPCILVPAPLHCSDKVPALAGFSGDAISLNLDKQNGVAFAHIVKYITEIATEHRKSTDNLADIFTSVVDKVSHLDVAIHSLTQARSQLMKYYEVVAKEEEATDKQMTAKEKKLLKTSQDCANVLKSLSDKVEEASRICVAELNQLTNTMVERITESKAISEDLEHKLLDARHKYQSVTIGKAVKALYNRIEIKERQIKNMEDLIESSNAECRRVEEANLVLTRENIQLRKEFTEWLKENHKELYNMLKRYNGKPTAKADVREMCEKASDILGNIKQLETDVRDVAGSKRIMVDTLADVSKRAREIHNVIAQATKEAIKQNKQSMIAAGARPSHIPSGPEEIEADDFESESVENENPEDKEIIV